MYTISKQIASSLVAVVMTVSCWAEQAQVAVAANFAEPIKALAAMLEKNTGHQLLVSTGATGKLRAQIENGAPFDVLLSADSATPLALEKSGLAVTGSRFTYARGKLVLWSADPQRVDAQGVALQRGNFRKLAHANPTTAPYGAAALQVIEQLGLSAKLKAQLVQGESIGQTYSFVATGNAELGFVALSQVLRDGKLKAGSMWLVPQTLYSPIAQDAVLLQRGAHNRAALALLALLQDPATKTLLRGFGYEL